MFFFEESADPRDLHSFPTRRSSDLAAGASRRTASSTGAGPPAGSTTWCAASPTPIPGPSPRSEEHTSELQSRGHLVCRLLLEKKKPYHAARVAAPVICSHTSLLVVA